MSNVKHKKDSPNDMHEKPWTFITNHAAVLSLIVRHPRITAREISREVGITERSVRLIIRDLDEGGYIKKISEGRRIQYFVNSEKPMRHRTQRDIAISSLLSILNTKQSPIDEHHIT